jgi:hypothetical protein
VTTIENPAKIVLKDADAIALWLKGKDVWNAWVKENPVADVSFKGVGFDTLLKEVSPDIDFAGFHFPVGYVDFRDTKFGKCVVSFTGANFGEGTVNFGRAEFCGVYVSFTGSKFGKGKVLFGGTKFGKGNVQFSFIEFGDCDVLFNKANFGKGGVEFSGTKFSKGRVSFRKVNFGDGNVIFKFVNFGDGNVVFYGAHFGKGIVSFEGTFFGGQLDMRECDKTGDIQSFSFKNCQFKSAVTLEGLRLSCVLDLTNTSLQHQISLEGLVCKLKRTRSKFGFNVAADENDITRFRRLKEVCENNKDHELALAFHANEMRAKRWHKTRWLASWADMAYSLLSDYGQSVSRPLMSLVMTWFIFAGAYASIAKNFLWDSCYQWLQMMGFSIVHSMPLLPIGRSVRKAAFEGYFVDSQSYVFALMTVQSLASLLLIFLVGLGLRNRFRI